MNRRKLLVVYHKVDYDGVFSACIVKKWVEDNPEFTCELVPWTYGDPIPELLGRGAERVVMVDIMLPPEVMMELKEKIPLTVIDHHETAIKSSVEGGYDDLDGIREMGKGACELVWRFFYPTIKTPKIIRLLSAYDVWDHTRFNWKEETVPLQLVLKAEYGVKTDLIYPEFKRMLEPGYDFNSLMEKGHVIQQYEEKQFIGACRNYIFPVLVAGKYKGVACLTHTFGSRLFESVAQDYDVFITLNRKLDAQGRVIFTAGLYSDGGIGDFSLARYVQERYGKERGGGHPKACGCWFTPEEFIRILMNCEI